jgi:hypothetical protein
MRSLSTKEFPQKWLKRITAAVGITGAVVGGVEGVAASNKNTNDEALDNLNKRTVAHQVLNTESDIPDVGVPGDTKAAEELPLREEEERQVTYVVESPSLTEASPEVEAIVGPFLQNQDQIQLRYDFVKDDNGKAIIRGFPREAAQNEIIDLAESVPAESGDFGVDAIVYAIKKEDGKIYVKYAVSMNRLINVTLRDEEGNPTAPVAFPARSFLWENATGEPAYFIPPAMPAEYAEALGQPFVLIAPMTEEARTSLMAEGFAPDDIPPNGEIFISVVTVDKKTGQALPLLISASYEKDGKKVSVALATRLYQRIYMPAPEESAEPTPQPTVDEVTAEILPMGTPGSPDEGGVAVSLRGGGNESVVTSPELAVGARIHLGSIEQDVTVTYADDNMRLLMPDEMGGGPPYQPIENVEVNKEYPWKENIWDVYWPQLYFDLIQNGKLTEDGRTYAAALGVEGNVSTESIKAALEARKGNWPKIPYRYKWGSNGQEDLYQEGYADPNKPINVIPLPRDMTPGASQAPKEWIRIDSYSDLGLPNSAVGILIDPETGQINMYGRVGNDSNKGISIMAMLLYRLETVFTTDDGIRPAPKGQYESWYLAWEEEKDFANSPSQFFLS